MGTGPTPIVDVDVRVAGALRTVGLKLEGANPGGSIKDRTARSLLHSLESAGRLRPGDRLVESTSGNLGVALAMCSAARGYSFTAVVDPKVDPGVLDRIRSHGADVVVVTEPDSAGGYLLSRLAAVRRLSEAEGMVWPNQYDHPANPLAHFRHTAPELHGQRPDIDAVFVATSTGGTLAGVSWYFRAADPRVRVVAVDVRGSQVFGMYPAPRLLNGIGSSRRSTFLTPKDYDHVAFVGHGEAIAACHALHARTGIGLGGSAGATLAACARVLARHPEIRRPVCICPDGRANYLSTIYSGTWLAAQGVDLDEAVGWLPFTDAALADQHR